MRRVPSVAICLPAPAALQWKRAFARPQVRTSSPGAEDIRADDPWASLKLFGLTYAAGFVAVTLFLA